MSGTASKRRVFATFVVATLTIGGLFVAIPPPPGADSATPVAFRSSVVTPAARDITKFGTLPADLRPGFSVPADAPHPLPTNSWWSSGVLDQWPAPLFAWPLVATFGQNGLTVDAPGRETLPAAVVAAARNPFVIAPADGALARAKVRSWGDWDATFDGIAGNGAPAFSVTAIQGSPLLFIRPYADLLLTPPGGATMQSIACNSCGSAVVMSASKNTYLLVTSPGTKLRTDLKGTRLTAGANALLTVVIVAPGSKPAEYLSYALRPYSGTRASFKVTGDRVETTYTFPVQTLMGILPHQQPVLAANPGAAIGTYESLRGTIVAYRGSSFTTVLPRPAVLPSLPLADSLKTDPAFIATLTKEIAEHRPSPTEIYNSAKDLLRTATLAELADETGKADLRAQATADLRDKLVNWCTAKPGEKDHYFAYDTALGGIIAMAPGYGSEHFNDHHFHYGYFLRSAAVMARLDPTFVNQYGDCLRLLALDIASIKRDDASFPMLRYFDVYAGHSWANGLTKFNDAQNQESTSEAMQAWFGMVVWGRASGDKVMEDTGTWLLAQEAQSTRAYWFNALPANPTLPKDFTKPMISLLWGGKSDYATFFDPSPEAIQGIQLFPVTTALLPVIDQPLLAKLATPLSDRNSAALWKITMNLASALNGQPITISPNAEMDIVYSKSFQTAWVTALAKLGAYQAQFHPLDSCAGAVFGPAGKRTAVAYRGANSTTSCMFTAVGEKPITLTNLKNGWNVRPVY